MAKKSNRNENIPFYFEILYAGIDFLKLLEKGTNLLRIEVKPDRKYGHQRRIEDLTKFYNDNSVETVQIKHSIDSKSKLGFGDLWTATPRIKTLQTSKKEGTNIFKFLKSWRIHKKNGKSVMLTLASNRTPTTALQTFLSDIESLRDRKLLWKNFKTQYSSEISNIKENCRKRPFTSESELLNFIRSFRFEKLVNIDELEGRLADKLRNHGVITDERLNAYINRINKTFISNQIEVLPQRVLELIDRLKTGLIQEIATPPNYVERSDLEKKILLEIELKKKDGGFVFIFAPSGSGKTILLSQLSERNSDFLPYFCRIRPFEAVKGKTGYSNNNRLSSKWFKADIIQRCYEFGLLPMLVGVDETEESIDKIFDEALTLLSKKALERPNKKIVIIVDALDQVETDKYRGNSVLNAIPTVNYPGIVFLLSTWGEKYLPISVKNLPKNVKSRIGVDLYFTKEEITNYFKQANIKLNQDQIALVKKKTSGLAISLFYLNKKFKRSRDIDNTIDSITNYTDVFDWYEPIWDSLSVSEKNCLGYLCFHFAEVKRDNLRNMVRGLSLVQFNDLMKTIDHFLDNKGGLIEPYHDSFRRFIIDKLSDVKKNYHSQLADFYSKYIQLTYTKKFITKHLEAAGVNSKATKQTFKKLNKNGFFKKLLKTNLDDRTKVEVGQSFVDYFYRVKNIKDFVQYAVVTSNIYPVTYGSHVGTKAIIATEKLLSEIEEELLLRRDGHVREQRDWVFKRLMVGNILIAKNDKNCISLAKRFLDDGLFRISLNTNLIWGEEFKHDFWDHVEIFLHALVNAGRYRKAILYLKRVIRPTEPKPFHQGMKASYLASMHLLNLRFSHKETIEALAEGSKVERLITYMEMKKKGLPIPDLADFNKLLSNKHLEIFLYQSGFNNQYLDLANALFIYKSKNYKVRIKKLLSKIKVEVPYHQHSYTYWGNPKSTRMRFLNWIALKGLVEKNFNIEEYYSEALKEKFKKSDSYTEHHNEGFVNVLKIEFELTKNRLLWQAKKISWRQYWNEFERSLLVYKGRVDELKKYKKDKYESDSKKMLYPYIQDLAPMLRENVGLINIKMLSKYIASLNKVENTLKDYLFDEPGLLETLCEISERKTEHIKDKLKGYLERALEIRRKEASDNMNKSDTLRDLAVLAAEADFTDMAERIYEDSMKYARGLWSKEDLRFMNLVNALRTQKSEEFKIILNHINKVADVVEGSWYWKLSFLESATFADYKLGFDYCYEFIVTGESNQNTALRRIISSYTKHYPINTLNTILPLLDLMDIKDESGYEYLEIITSAYLDVIQWLILNNNYQVAEEQAEKYFDIVLKDIEPEYRIKILKNFIKRLNPTNEFTNIISKINSHLLKLDSDGYLEVKSNNSYEETEKNYGGADILNLEKLAKQGKIRKLLKELDKESRGYYMDIILSRLVHSLSTSDISIVRKWANQNAISLDKPKFLSAMIKKASYTKNISLLKKTSSEIIRSYTLPKRGSEIYRMITELDTINFIGKKTLIKKLLLIGIRKMTGSSHGLSELFYYASGSIDQNYLDLKKFSYQAWKDVVETSIRLSLSK